MSALTDLLNDALEAATEDDDYVIARRVLHSELFSPTQIDLVVSLVADRVANLRRATARVQERAAFASFVTASPRLLDSTPLDERQPDDPFYALITAGIGFKLGDGDGEVTWERATVADHELRIARLSALRNGIDKTIGQHRMAIERIRAAGVSCLGDLMEQAA